MLDGPLEHYAVKTVNKRQLTVDSHINLQEEISILKQIKSSHVISLLEVIDTADTVYLVTDYCNGGDLGKAIECGLRFGSEELPKKIIR